MAFGVRHRCEFADIEGLVWKWDFEFDGYVGSTTTMQAAGDPMDYDCLSGSDDLYEDPIRGTSATLRVITNSLGQWDIYSTVGNFEVRVSIYQGGTLYFRGWVQPGMVNEAYDDYPYVVAITATDGLGYLKELDYTPTTEGRRSEDDIIITDILSQIQVTGFNETINIYEENMSATTTDSPISQTFPDADAFEEMTCYEALEYILKKWRALIRQRDGIFWIYRPKEMIGTAYARKFTSVGVKTAETINYTQEISRTATPSDFRSTNGGLKCHLPPAKKITLIHDLGNKESWIKNWEFKAETFDGTDFEEWAQVNDTNGVRHVSEVVSGEKNGVAITSSVADFSFAQSFAPLARISTHDSLVLEFDWGMFNNYGETTYLFKMVIRQGSLYLTAVSDTIMTWVPYYSSIGIASPAPAALGWTGWTHWKRQIDLAGICQDGDLLIAIYPEWTYKNGTIIPCVKDIEFYITSYELQARKTSMVGRNRFSNLSSSWNKKFMLEKVLKEVKSAIYEIDGATYGESVEEDHLIGDVLSTDTSITNVLEQFKGSLAYAEVIPPHAFKTCFIRNTEMDQTLSIAASTMLAITSKSGQVLTVDNLPDNADFDINGWCAMIIDEAKTTTTDPTPTGDYLYKNFVTIDRAAKTLTFPTAYSLANWAVGDNIAVYNPFLNYEFVGDQTQGTLVVLAGAPAWRASYSINGGMFRHSDGRFIWVVNGHSGSAYSIGFIYSSDMVTWTMGNSDASVFDATDFPNCTGVHQAGSINPVDGSPGSYWALIHILRTSDGKNETRIIYFDEDFGSMTYSAAAIYDISAWALGAVVGGIVKIGSYYHAACYCAATALSDRQIRAAKSLTLEGPYTDYQTILAGTAGVNDGAPWSNNVDNFGIFFDGTTYYGLVGSTSKWSESGNKGNREYVLVDFDVNTETWSFSTKGTVIINPLYYQDINSTYLWAGDHLGGYLAMFVEGNDVYLSLTMKGSLYQAGLFKFNNTGNIFPTGLWARRGVTESKNILQIAGEELALQKSSQRQMLTGLPVYDRAISSNAAHLNILGTFSDALNEVSVGVPRKFAFNKGSLKVKERLWIIDLIEIKT